MTKVKKPDQRKLEELSAKEHFNLSSDEIMGVSSFFDDLLGSINVVDELYDRENFGSEHGGQRGPGRRSDKSEDPYNAFTLRFLIKGSGEGVLKGKKFGIKDNINIAGYPTSNASALAKDFIPDTDATVITRLLEAGADIVGKLNLDNLSFSGTSETSIFGPVKNPVNTAYSPGGSSSGSGAAVAGGLVDIALGVDQGGSARVPACCTGIVAIKPTQGLVPTYGLTYMDHTIDHICPMAKNVKDVAATLEVIAGYDKRDPQWTRTPLNMPSIKYSAGLEEQHSVRNVKVGVVNESLDWKETDPEIKECFLEAVDRLGHLCSSVEQFSMPIFKASGAIWITAVVHSTHAMYDSSGEGYWHGGQYNPKWNEHIGKARKEMANEMPPLLKCSMISGRYMREEYFSTYHSKAQNLRNLLREEIDESLSKYDLLATPTLIVKPPRLKEKISFEESLRRGVLLLTNTTAFNLSGHPAISIPCGMRGGFPVGLQLIGRHYEESLLFKTAQAFESDLNAKRS